MRELLYTLSLIGLVAAAKINNRGFKERQGTYGFGRCATYRCGSKAAKTLAAMSMDDQPSPRPSLREMKVVLESGNHFASRILRKADRGYSCVERYTFPSNEISGQTTPITVVCERRPQYEKSCQCNVQPQELHLASVDSGGRHHSSRRRVMQGAGVSDEYAAAIPGASTGGWTETKQRHEMNKRERKRNRGQATRQNDQHLFNEALQNFKDKGKKYTESEHRAEIEKLRKLGRGGVAAQMSGSPQNDQDLWNEAYGNIKGGYTQSKHRDELRKLGG